MFAWCFRLLVPFCEFIVQNKNRSSKLGVLVVLVNFHPLEKYILGCLKHPNTRISRDTSPWHADPPWAQAGLGGSVVGPTRTWQLPMWLNHFSGTCRILRRMAAWLGSFELFRGVRRVQGVVDFCVLCLCIYIYIHMF